MGIQWEMHLNSTSEPVVNENLQEVLVELVLRR